MHRRSAVALLTALLLLSAFSNLAVAQTGTPISSPEVNDGVYHDPDGLFSVPIPTNWTVEYVDAVPVLTDPDGDLQIAALVVKAESAEVGIDAGWDAVFPDVNRVIFPNIQPLDIFPGIDESLVITDDFGEQTGQVVQAIGWRIGDQVYVILALGTYDAAVRRASQTQIIIGGFEITALADSGTSAVDLLPFSGALIEEFDDYVADLLDRLEVPGASVAVVVDGKITFISGYGTTELGGDQLVGPDTMMMIGSSTKSMTTMMMASEIDDGLFTWDTPVIELYPEFAVADPLLSQTLTMRNMVCACTGVPRRDLEFALNAESLTPQDVIDSLGSFEFYSGFGEAFQYSNQMVAAGGYIAANVDHPGTDLESDYQQSLQTRVFDPIGMSRSTLSFAEVENDSDYARPHGLSLEGYVPIPLWYEEALLPVAPAGSVWSTATDMSRYLITQMQDGVAPDGIQIVSQENLVETREPQVQVDSTTDYGLGWLVSEYEGQPVVWHNGNTFGFSSDLAFLPEANIGIVVLANGQGANFFTEGVRTRLFEMIFGQDAVLDSQINDAIASGETQLAELQEQIGNRPARANVVDLLGSYTNPDLGNVDLSIDSRGALMLDTGEFQMEVRFLTGGSIKSLVTIDPPLVLSVLEVHTTDQTVELVLDSGIDRYVFTRVDSQTESTPGATPIAA